MFWASRQHDAPSSRLDEQAGQRTAVRGVRDVGGVLRLDPPRRLQDALQQVFARRAACRWSIGPGRAACRGLPILWQLPQLSALDQNSFSPRPASPFSARMVAGPGVRAELARRCSRRAAGSPRRDRAPGRRAAWPPRPAACRAGGRFSSPRPSLRASSMADFGSASSFSGGPCRSGLPSRTLPLPMAGDPVLDELQARFVGPLGADVRHPVAAELGHAEVQRARPRIARLDDAGVRQPEVAARRPDADRLHRRRSATENCSRRGTEPPPCSEWQCPQLACR